MRKKDFKKRLLRLKKIKPLSLLDTLLFYSEILFFISFGTYMALLLVEKFINLN